MRNALLPLILVPSAIACLCACGALLDIHDPSGPLDTSDASSGDAVDQVDGGEASTPTLALTLGTASAEVTRSEFDLVPITLSAHGVDEAVTVDVVAGLPIGVTADQLRLDATLTEGVLTLRANATAAVGTGAKLTLVATAGSVSSPPVTLPLVVRDRVGALDTTFGNAGVVSVQVPGVGGAALGSRGLVVQADGRIAFAGTYGGSSPRLLVGRLEPNGTPDKTFATGGFLTKNADGFTGEVGSVLMALPGGGLVVAGFGTVVSNHSMIVLELTDDGALDPSFAGGAGILDLDDGNIDAKANDAVLQPDGRVVVGGFRPYGTPALARITSAGAQDSSFDPSPDGRGTVGIRTYAGQGDQVTGLAVLPNGALLASTSSTTFRAQRFTSAGAIDFAFGDSGVASAPGDLTGNVAVLVHPSGAFTLVGATANSVELARFDPSGTIDVTFGSGGRASVHGPGGDVISPRAAMLLPDGRVVVGAVLSTNYAGVLLITPNGEIDTTFATGGWASSYTSGGGNAEALAIDPFGRILVATASEAKVSVARFWL